MWSMSDVWMLRSIGGRDEATGVSLRSVLAAADYHNHAIPEEDELCGAVGRLIGAGLVAADGGGDRYWLTAAGAPLAHRPGTLAAGLAELQKLPVPAAAPWVLPPGAFRAAVEAYLG